jgi:hypothetical protein
MSPETSATVAPMAPRPTFYRGARFRNLASVFVTPGGKALPLRRDLIRRAVAGADR